MGGVLGNQADSDLSEVPEQAGEDHSVLHRKPVGEERKHSQALHREMAGQAPDRVKESPALPEDKNVSVLQREATERS